MRITALLMALAALALAALSGVSLAQMHGGMHGGGQAPMMGGQQMMGPGMMHNMDMMSQMMKQMHQMMGQEKMSPEAQQQMLDMMSQMGAIMQQMRGPQAGQLQQQHEHQLHEMQKRLEALSRQGQHQH